jgi:hypothetical protein
VSVEIPTNPDLHGQEVDEAAIIPRRMICLHDAQRVRAAHGEVDCALSVVTIHLCGNRLNSFSRCVGRVPFSGSR